MRVGRQKARGAVQAGNRVDDAEFARFYDANRAVVRRVVARRINDGALREEAAQDAFTRAAQLLADGHPDPPMRAIAAHASIDVLRRHRRRMERVEPLDPVELARSGLLGLSDDNPEGVVLEAERRQVITEALGRVEARQRRVLVLREVEGLPYEAIAAATGASMDSLRSLVKRGRARFREAYMSIAAERGLLAGAMAWARGLGTRLSARLSSHAQEGEVEFVASSWAQWLSVVPMTMAATAVVLVVTLGPSTHGTASKAQRASSSAGDAHPTGAAAPGQADLHDRGRHPGRHGPAGESVVLHVGSPFQDRPPQTADPTPYGGNPNLVIGLPGPLGGYNVETRIKCNDSIGPLEKRHVCEAAERVAPAR